MKRKIALCLLVALPAMNMVVQGRGLSDNTNISINEDPDPIVMTVGGRQVTRSEFEYALNKNYTSPSEVGQEDIKKYADLYAVYLMKVQAAKDMRLDTLSSFRTEFRKYRDIQLRPFVYDSLYADSVARRVYEAMQQSVGDSDILHVSHILLSVPQDASNAFVARQKEKADSLYHVLENGADFHDLARRFSQDRRSAPNGGLLPWIGPAQVIPEFWEAATSLQVGHYSQPVLTAVGYHIIMLEGRKKLKPYAQKKAEILSALNPRGLQVDAAEHEISRLVKAGGGSLTREQVVAEVEAKAVKSNPRLKYLIGEYHDGLLLYEVSNRMVWDAAAKDVKGQEDYFRSHRNDYKWDAPRFRGYTYRARSRTMLRTLRKLLKGCKEDEGLALVKSRLPKDSLNSVRVHFGVFKQGDDPIVDYLQFVTGKEPKKNTVIPFYGSVGKMLKKPKSLIDVKSLVVADYQNQREKEWVATLRQQYPCHIDEAVLSTVNHH